MTRGFTLLELAIVIGLISMTLLWAIPSFRSVSETAQMTRLASELYGFIVQAKSQAKLRRQLLWVHIFQSGQNWELRLTDDKDRTQGRLITKLSGLSFKGTSLFQITVLIGSVLMLAMEGLKVGAWFFTRHLALNLVLN